MPRAASRSRRHRLEPGKYTLRARASRLSSFPARRTANVAAGQEAKSDLKLTKLRSLSAHLTNAEWLHSMPGTDAAEEVPAQLHRLPHARTHHEVVL